MCPLLGAGGRGSLSSERPVKHAGGRAAKVRRSDTGEVDGDLGEGTLHTVAVDDAADAGDQRPRQLLGETDEHREARASGTEIARKKGKAKGKFRKDDGETSPYPDKQQPHRSTSHSPETIVARPEEDEAALIAGIAAGVGACVLVALGFYFVIKRARRRVKDGTVFAKNRDRQPSALVTTYDEPCQPNLPSAVWGPPHTPREDDGLTRSLGPLHTPREDDLLTRSLGLPHTPREDDGLTRSFREQLSPLPSPLPFAAERRYSDGTSASRVTVPIILDFALQSESRAWDTVSPSQTPKFRLSTDTGELHLRDAAPSTEDVRSPSFRFFAAPPAPLRIPPLPGQPGLSPFQKTPRPDSVSSVSSWLEDVSWQASATGLADPQMAKSPPPQTASIRNHLDGAESPTA